MHRLNALTFKQLRSLQAVAATQSISRAADRLGLTPPAVHSQLKALEENFGCAMLLREGPASFTPTPEGQALLDAYAKVEAGLGLAIYRIESLRKGLVGTVVLGVVSTGKYFAPALVARIKKAYPQIEVLLQIGNRDRIIGALEDGAIDLAIMGRPPRQPPLTAIPIGDHPHVLIAPPEHRLAGLHPAGPADILAETIVAREAGSGTRILASRFLDRIGEGQPYETLVMDSNETIKQAVMAGLGIAIISQHTVTEELRSGRLVAVAADGLPILRKWYVLHRQDLKLSGALTSVLNFIDTQQGQFLPQI